MPSETAQPNHWKLCRWRNKQGRSWRQKLYSWLCRGCEDFSYPSHRRDMSTGVVDVYL